MRIQGALRRTFSRTRADNDDQVLRLTGTEGAASSVPEYEHPSHSEGCETAYLMSSRNNARRLRESVAEYRSGRTQEHELVDPDGE